MDTPEVYQTEKEYRKKLREFEKKYETHMIVTSRFTNETFSENESFRKKNPKVGCVYCSPTPMTNGEKKKNSLYSK